MNSELAERHKAGTLAAPTITKQSRFDQGANLDSLGAGNATPSHPAGTAPRKRLNVSSIAAEV